MGARELYLAAVARPGDTVLIGFAHSLSDEDIDALDESFRPLIEQGIKVGFMDQVTSMVVFRPDEPIPFELTGEAGNGASAVDVG